MRDFSSYPMHNDDSGEESANTSGSKALQPMDRASLTTQVNDPRTELYARLRTIIDNATESIRALKEENAAVREESDAVRHENSALKEENATLADQIRVVTAELAQDERALSESAAALEQLLRDTPTAEPTPITAVPSASEPAMEMAPEMTGEAAPAPEASEDLDAPVMEAAEEPATEAMEPDASPVMTEAEVTDTPAMETAPAEMSGEESVAPPSEEPVDEEMPAPPPIPIKTEESDAMVAAAKQDAAYTLIAYPFVRFSDLGQFQTALQKLTGVHDIQVRRFAQGTLEMRISYDGVSDLASALRTLETEVEDVREEAPDRLRLRLRASHDA